MNHAKYDVFSVKFLIAAVQETAVKIINAKRDGLSKTKIDKLKKDISEMRYSLINRLSKMDRTDPKFFPKNAVVRYQKVVRTEDLFDFSKPAAAPPKIGVVIEHDTTKVLVRLSGDEHFTRVDPEDITLLFIRNNDV